MRYLSFLAILMLGACTSYNETFDCEPGRGVGCKSLSQVNHMVDRGDLPVVEDSIEETSLTHKDIPQITSSQGLRIWIAPNIEGGKC